MKKEEIYTGARVRIWNQRLEEYQFGEVLQLAGKNLPGVIQVCLDDDVLPYRLFNICDLEKSV